MDDPPIALPKNTGMTFDTKSPQERAPAKIAAGMINIFSYYVLKPD